MAKNSKAIAIVIPTSGTESAVLTLDLGRIPVALEMPSAFTGTTLTFKASSSESGIAVPLYFESTLYSVTVGPSRYVSLNRAAFEGVKFLTIVSGTVEPAARTINVVIGE